MNLAVLTTFLAVIETGSLIRAAEKLNVTQSTVTARINNLEQDLGQVLFHRRRSGTELTSSGFKFQRYAQVMTEVWRQARLETSLPPQAESLINIGCHMDLWPDLGRDLVHGLRQQHPNVALSAWQGEQGDLNRWLGTGLVDAALCYTPTIAENQTVTVLQVDQMVLVTTHQEGGNPDQLLSAGDYIYVDGGEDFRRRHALAYPLMDTPAVTIGSAVWALDNLLQLGGTAYLPRRIVQAALATGRLREVAEATTFERRSYLITNKNSAADQDWIVGVLSKQRA
ncbi:LysR family transcriptional regulator [Rhodovibrionaceae bacterium A322]